ncbi:MAG: hypothetical protein GXP31_13795 [Kiritimatiellaeota bacterium]|nr:hypothetical protein [Kiritimatiellota bacterium]
MTTSVAVSWIESAISVAVVAGASAVGAAPANGARAPIAAASQSLQHVSRRIPAPLAGHPGNVFMEGETVRIPVPAALRDKTRFRRVTDERGEEVAQAAAVANSARPVTEVVLGRLPLGWYRIEFLDAARRTVGWTSAAVLHRLGVPVPQDSPVCVDSATAWFAARYRPEEERAREVFATLAALAGANWIRDRLSWGEIETGPDKYAAPTRYDSSARLATEHGLKTLQVFHSTPGWAVDKALDGERGGRRFPRDLRVLYRFCRTLAVRFKGRVFAWEPWNEANIGGFGGHPINEMCSLQKAAYLGFKAGDPRVTVCWNVFAGGGNDLQTEGVLENEAWPYFETYNIHSYSAPGAYRDQFANARQAACGRPLWISECGIRLPTRSAPPWGDMTPADELRQAEFIARSVASSLYAGVDRHFFFILGNYIEHDVQFGLLRHDFTPRPGYCALAAVGRFLAGAECRGQLPLEGKPETRAIVFRARPDGRRQDVVIAWAARATEWSLPGKARIDGMFDYLGRPRPATTGSLRVGPRPVFILLPPGETDDWPLEPPPNKAPARPGTPTPIVLQTQMPLSAVRLNIQGFQAPVGKAFDVPVDVYNFSDAAVHGVLAVDKAPPGWKLDFAPASVGLDPMGRVRITVRIDLEKGGRAALFGAWVQLRGDFGKAGRPVLAFRLAADPAAIEPTSAHVVASGDRSGAWADNIVGGARMQHGPAPGGGVRFDMRFADSDPWAYPRLDLDAADRPPADYDGLRLTVQLLEGSGAVRVQFIEDNGASYITDLSVKSDVRTPQIAVALFRNAHWGSWSKPDVNRRLDLDRVRTILVGINSKRNSTVRMVVRDLAWVKY